jgi:hypothetical protein
MVCLLLCLEYNGPPHRSEQTEATDIFVRKTEFPFRQTTTEDWHIGEIRIDEHGVWRVVSEYPGDID